MRYAYKNSVNFVFFCCSGRLRVRGQARRCAGRGPFGHIRRGLHSARHGQRSAKQLFQRDQRKIHQRPVGVDHVVFFDYDSFVVRADARPVIENHARFLQANKQRKANLEGHTDERGGREYNLALGQKRAEAVRQALALLGVSDSQLEAVSYGKEKPAAQGSGESDLAKNRRVEIRY